MTEQAICFNKVLTDVRTNREKSDKERIEALELCVAQLKHRLFRIENKGHSE